ncbi:MAG: amino acid ABC transporter permease [Albidovulum sp.]|nr:amino acid ABC transporter permease [Albidovulum sp.]
MIDLDFLASLDFSVPWEFRWQLVKDAGMTLFLAAVSSVIGLLLGILLAIVVRSGHLSVRYAALAYIEFFRNTPLLVQLIWIHFVLPMATGINTTPLASGLIALTLNVTAYFCEIARAGINSVPKGQWEAATALGLRRFPVWTKVILPQALRVMIPPLANMVINIFKATAILSILAVDDLMRVAIRISNSVYKPVEMITSAALIYLVIGSFLAFSADALERKYGPEGRKV